MAIGDRPPLYTDRPLSIYAHMPPPVLRTHNPGDAPRTPASGPRSVFRLFRGCKKKVLCPTGSAILNNFVNLRACQNFVLVPYQRILAYVDSPDHWTNNYKSEDSLEDERPRQEQPVASRWLTLLTGLTPGRGNRRRRGTGPCGPGDLPRSRLMKLRSWLLAPEVMTQIARSAAWNSARCQEGNWGADGK